MIERGHPQLSVRCQSALLGVDRGAGPPPPTGPERRGPSADAVDGRIVPGRSNRGGVGGVGSGRALSGWQESIGAKPCRVFGLCGRV